MKKSRDDLNEMDISAMMKTITSITDGTYRKNKDDNDSDNESSLSSSDDDDNNCKEVDAQVASDSDDDTESDEDNKDVANLGIGDKVYNAWMKRRDKLVHPWSIAAWFVNPI